MVVSKPKEEEKISYFKPKKNIAKKKELSEKRSVLKLYSNRFDVHRTLCIIKKRIAKVENRS